MQEVAGPVEAIQRLAEAELWVALWKAVVARPISLRRAPLASVEAVERWHRMDPRLARPSSSDKGPGFDALLLRVAGGDQGAFAAVYDATANKVFGLVGRIVVDSAMAEEVTQEIFLEIWQKAPKFDPQRGTALTWIMTIAHRRAVDRVRREQSLRDRSKRVEMAGDSGPFDAVAEEVEKDWERSEVRRAIDALTDLQRESLELAYFGGYTYREVAEILDAPLGTVKTRLRDGLLRLKAALRESA